MIWPLVPHTQSLAPGHPVRHPSRERKGFSNNGRILGRTGCREGASFTKAYVPAREVVAVADEHVKTPVTMLPGSSSGLVFVRFLVDEALNDGLL